MSPATSASGTWARNPASGRGLTTRPADWRRSFFYCCFFERGFAIPTVTAVRTEAAKLIKYPGHDEWTEVFDLKNDPFEIRNLANDPASAALKSQLEAEYQQQAAAISFHIPPFADDPRQAGPELKAKKKKKPKP